MWVGVSKRAAILATVLLATSGARADTLVYAPWKKMCLRGHGGTETCFVTTGANLPCGLQIFGLSFADNLYATARHLLVVVPGSTVEESGVRLIIDRDVDITLPFTGMIPKGRFASRLADATLVEQFKRGRSLTVEVVDSEKGRMTFAVSLENFDKIYDGSGAPPKVIENIVSNEEMEEIRKRGEEQKIKAQRPGWPRCD